MTRFKLALWIFILASQGSFASIEEERTSLQREIQTLQERVQACEEVTPVHSACSHLRFTSIASYALPSLVKPIGSPTGVYWGAPLGQTYDYYPVLVTYEEAFEYCQSRGARLPTEAMLNALVEAYTSACPDMPTSLVNEPIFRGVSRFWLEDQEGLPWFSSRVFLPASRTIWISNNYSGETTHPVLCVSE